MHTAARNTMQRTLDLREKIARHGLEKNIADLAIDGYTVIEDAAPIEFFDRLRMHITEVAARVREQRRFPTNLLGEGEVFEEAVQIPQLDGRFSVSVTGRVWLGALGFLRVELLCGFFDHDYGFQNSEFGNRLAV